MLLIASISIAAVSSAVLLLGGWGNTQPPSAAAYREEPREAATVTVLSAAAEVVVASDAAAATVLPTPSPRPFVTQEPTPEAPTPRPAAGVAAAATVAHPPAATNIPTPYAAPDVPLVAPPAVPTVRHVATVAPRPATATPRPRVATSTPHPTSTPAPPPASCPNAGLSSYAAVLYDALNAERVAYGLAPLGNAGCVNYVAQLRADDMAALNYFSHTSPNGDTAFSLLDAYGIPRGWAGENLARNNYPDDQTVAVAVRDLMASDAHRSIILNANFTHIGVAAAFDGAGMFYFAMVYIGVP